MAYFRYPHIRMFCTRLEELFNSLPNIREYGVLSISEIAKQKRPYTRIKWEASDGWFIAMDMNVGRVKLYTKKCFTDICYNVYYNVLDMLVDLTKHWCVGKSNELTHIDGIIKEISDGRY